MRTSSLNTLVIRWALIMSTVFLSAPSVACELTIFGNENKPPKYWLEGNEPKGILIDLLTHLSNEIDCEFDFVLLPWARAYALAESGQGAITGLSYTETRAEIFHFSNILFIDELLVVTRKGEEFEFESIDDLSDKTVAVTRGSVYGSAFAKAVENGILKVLEVSDPDSRFKMLLANRVDVVIIGPGQAGFDAAMASNPWLLERKDDFSLLSTPFKRDANYIGIPKTMDVGDLLDRINEEISNMKESGVYDDILKSYAGF